MSRIWQALRTAERERAHARASQPGGGDIVTIPDIDSATSVAPEEEASVAPSIQELDVDQRRGLRHAHETIVLVYGSGLDKQPFHEESETIDANENGCLLSLASEVARGQRLVLTNMRNSAEQECRVVYVGRKNEGKVRVGVEFVKPAPHFWRLA
jgi:hypothetical protein